MTSLKPRQNLWPWAIICAFSLFFCGTISLVVLASSQKVDLVSSDYYEKEIKFQNQIERFHSTARLGAQASVAYDATNKLISINLPAEQVGHALSGRIEFYRPSSASLDRVLTLSPNSNGIQTIDTTGLVPGLWKVRVSWTASEGEFFIDQRVVIKNPA
ncbi:MAG TPA: FixH family protein [Candidatus Dormibacteraeota bacterium]|nr:FixH family protein [Candidatus Dormibacteraeota bacterium]